MSSDKFDPLAYIEKAFQDAETAKESGTTNGVKDSVVDIPSIGEYLRANDAKKSATALIDRPGSTKSAAKFRKRHLSAPRPRRVKEVTSVKQIDPEIQAIWQYLPKNIDFLSSFFDDSVTANYYRGEFKETRQELIRRLLDPELTLEEVSRLLGVCPATVRRYTNRNWLSHHRTKGGQRRFRLSGVVRFVEEHGRHPEG